MASTTPTTSSETMRTRETHDLIASDKVEGTAVYRPDGTRIGTIDRVMIDKIGGNVAYAVMSFGGFLGMGKDHYPLPWSMLTYNTALGGYECNVSEQQLKNAPRYADENDWSWSDPARGRDIDQYYGVRGGPMN